MITTGGNQRRPHAASTPVDAATIERDAAERARRGHRRAHGPSQEHSHSALERLRERLHSHQDQAVADVLAQERRRMAADLHDLVMQDLALALANARMLVDDDAQGSQAATVVAAAERALAGARHILDDVDGRERKPLLDTVRASVRAAAKGVPLSFRADGFSAREQPDQPTLDALVHIAREAVANAVKHAEPSSIAVLLEHADEWRLQVRDDGRGFEAPAARRGFGLESMRAQAQALGGSLRVLSVVEVGTTVEASLP
jgi:signal transduction histidine kinase